MAREPLQWGVASRRRKGEMISGDLSVVTSVTGGTLIAGIDGVGHGSHAARAAQAAALAMRAHPTADLAALVGRCHAALRGTRGAAISLVLLSHARSEISWLGVGNVEGRVVSGDPASPRLKASLALTGGVAGHELPAVTAASVPVTRGDLVFLATDGVGSDFADVLDVSGLPGAIAERIVAEHWTRRDDALVVAVRYLGGPR